MLTIHVKTVDIDNGFVPSKEGTKPITSQGLLSLSKSIREDIFRNEELKRESIELGNMVYMK